MMISTVCGSSEARGIAVCHRHRGTSLDDPFVHECFAKLVAPREGLCTGVYSRAGTERYHVSVSKGYQALALETDRVPF